MAKIGAVLVPINTRFRTRDMAYIVDPVRLDDDVHAPIAPPVDYLAMIEELLPDLRRQKAARCGERCRPCGG